VGFLSASASFTRYRIIEEIPDTLWPEIADRLRRNAFKDIDHTADERSFGWVAFDDMLDADWRSAPPQKGEFITMGLRLDTRRIPPAVFKKHLALALADEMERMEQTKGKAYVSRDRKNELKEQTKLRLMARTLPIPAQFDVVWNVTSGVVYLASIQSKLRALFEDMFTMTFDLHLEPMTPYYQALARMGEERASVLDDLEPTVFV
jgi:DNA recombination-dependent growth factor C